MRRTEPELTAYALEHLRRVLLGSSSEGLLNAVRRLGQGSPLVDADERNAIDALRQAGVVEPRSERLTEVGWLVADSVREYMWWIERDRRLPAEGEHPGLSLAHYEQKHVLEVGSGFGCNLLSMSQAPGHFVGLEPVTVYRQLTGLLAEREGLRAPQVVPGSAEALPFDDGQFDVVVCISAHQYMDVKIALREMMRVLRPGGQLQIVGGVMSLRLMWQRWRRELRLGHVKRDVLSLANTLSYQHLGRRLYVPPSGGSTSAPIYPSEMFMRKLLRDIGLRLREDWTRQLGPEFCFFAERLNG